MSVSVAASDVPAASITLLVAAVPPLRMNPRSLVLAVEPSNRSTPPDVATKTTRLAVDVLGWPSELVCPWLASFVTAVVPPTM